MIKTITDQARAGEGCSADEAIRLAHEVPLDGLVTSARAIRERFFDGRVELCTIVNARSGLCPMDCRFCSQSAHHKTGAEVYPLLDAEEIDRQVRRSDDFSADYCGLVTSGLSVDGDELTPLCEAIRRRAGVDGPRFCASLGQLDESALRRLKEAGLVRYHHNLETSEAFYPEICTTQAWRDRLATVQRARRVGLEVCCGGLFGLGETWEDRIDLALTLRRLEIDSVPINFLNPHPKTPIGAAIGVTVEPLSADEALRIIAVYRHLLPTATLRVCGGRPQVLGRREDEIFAAGANALMTGDYLTTSGRSPESDLQILKRQGLKRRR